ncbi:YbaY family lipoprotein [Paucibacter sp. TC2R-5]|uniref:YbaY family lipoprotein n=1 Tax=Paucibacter sp. TC2R-5 TaxID=2893555 RepID=UPI0021E4B9EF|nr:YbaY family lipoprotein [Paucibacter sp. TC2R-5]MCV2360944.1 YbaY family lipoprotein [Paucibacter sp. TC2R-5]
MKYRSALAFFTRAAAVLAALACGPGLAIAAAPSGAASAGEGAMFEVQGRASYRERIALPPQAVFTVRIEDVSLADAPAKLMAELSRPLGRSQAALDFKLTVPKTQVDPRHRYALRATIHVDGQLRFTSTQHYPVLNDAPAQPLELQLQAVARSSVGQEPARQASDKAGLSLPQSFAGVLPCADCAGIAHTLTLLPDGVYRMRQSYLGKPGLPLLQQGRWSVSQAGSNQSYFHLKLLNEQQSNYFLIQAQTAQTAELSLRQLDRQGQPFNSGANLLLRPLAALDLMESN